RAIHVGIMHYSPGQEVDATDQTKGSHQEEQPLLTRHSLTPQCETVASPAYHSGLRFTLLASISAARYHVAVDFVCTPGRGRAIAFIQCDCETIYDSAHAVCPGCGCCPGYGRFGMPTSNLANEVIQRISTCVRASKKHGRFANPVGSFGEQVKPMTEAEW